MNRSVFYFGLSVLVSIVLGGLLLSQIDAAALVRTFGNLHLPSLSVYIGLATLGIIFRSYRYHILLLSESIPFSRLILVTMVRNLFVDLLPAKTGSLSYVYLVNRRLKVPFEAAASSFLLASVFDLVVLFPLFFMAVAVTRDEALPLLSYPFIVLCAFLFLAVIFTLGCMHRMIRIAASLLDAFFNVPKQEGGKIRFVMDKLEKIASDLETLLTQKGRFFKILISSFFVRLCKYGSLYFLLHAVVAHLHFTFRNLDFWKVFIGILGAELSAVLPVHGIAGIGTWESAWALTFRFLGYFDPKIAILSGFGVHLTTQIFEYILGIFSIIFLYLPDRRSEGC